MKIKNDNSTYGTLARAFHWLTFLILLFQLPLGLYLDNLEFSEFKLTVENIHIVIGISIFYLTLLRLICHMTTTILLLNTLLNSSMTGGKLSRKMILLTLEQLPLFDSE